MKSLPEEVSLYPTSAEFQQLHQDLQHCLLHNSNLSTFIEQLSIVMTSHRVLYQKLTESLNQKKTHRPLVKYQVRISSKTYIYQAEACY